MLLDVPPTAPPRSKSISESSASSRRNSIARSTSTSALATMASVMSAPGLPRMSFHHDDDNTLSTLPDPRSPGLPHMVPRSETSSPHPDLNSEIASLSNKLISAINHQTSLDDTLSATRQELARAQDRIMQLEALNNEHARLLDEGALVRKTELEERVAEQLVEERKQRSAAEKDKKEMEQELENLTTSLFEEANEMVANARKEREVVEKQRDQYRAQLNDTQVLLASHQEQLTELKNVMQNMSSEEPEIATNGSTAPSTPAIGTHPDVSRLFDSLHLSPRLDDIPPAPPTSFAQLLSPVLRTDLQTYEDFRSLLTIPRKSSTPSSRVNSGSYSGISVLGMVNNAHRHSSAGQDSHIPSNSSQTSLSAAGPESSGLPGSLASPTIPLKETRFYKRALIEDIEPTLRLDTAPGLSWLNRRAVINSMSEGSLVVEPMPTSTRASMNPFSCSLCGENRKGDEFARTHRFRVSEADNAQRYPLCNYCLNRVRATCDYLGFLRMVKDGHWRTEGTEAEKLAWEESVRLRERMFWARIGGGVVPAFVKSGDSPRNSSEEKKPATNDTPISAPPVLNGVKEEPMPVKGSEAPTSTLVKENDDSFQPSPLSQEQSAGSGGISVISRKVRKDDDWLTAKNAAIFEDVKTMPPPAPPKGKRGSDASAQQLQNDLRGTLKPVKKEGSPLAEKEGVSEAKGAQDKGEKNDEGRGLSITIPGSFEF